MRHRKHKKVLDRKAPARAALFRSLLCKMVIHKKVKTTRAKASVLRTRVEKLVTKAGESGLQSRRELLRQLGNGAEAQTAIDILLKDLGPKYAKRPGGYTRTVKVGLRQGDAADMAIIEFV